MWLKNNQPLRYSFHEQTISTNRILKDVLNTVMHHLTKAYVLRNVTLGDSVFAQTHTRTPLCGVTCSADGEAV